MVNLNNLKIKDRINTIQEGNRWDVQLFTDKQVDDITGNATIGDVRSHATNDALINGEGQLNSWVKPATFDYFVDQMTQKTALLDISTVVQMNAHEHNLEYLYAGVDFDGGRFESGESKEFKDLRKIDPTMSITKLLSKDLAIGAELRQNELLYAKDPNLLNNFFGLIRSQLPNAFERWCVYAETGSGLGDMGLTNGWLATLKQLSFDSNNKYGFTPLLYHDLSPEEFLTSLENVQEQYISNNGKDIDLKWVLSSGMYYKLMSILDKRQTPLGDTLILDNGVLRFRGVEIIKANVFNHGSVRNGWDKLRVGSDGLPVKTSGDLVDKMEYGLLTEPSNIVAGVLPENGAMINSEAWKNQDADSYRLRSKMHADCTILSPKDTLVVPYTANNKS